MAARRRLLTVVVGLTLIASAAIYALASGTAAQSPLDVTTGAADYPNPGAVITGRAVVTMHADVQTAAVAAVWFEYRTGGRFGPPPYVIRTEPTVIAAGSHQVSLRSRTVSAYSPYSYRVVARVLGATARGQWRRTLNREPHGGLPPLPPLPPPRRP